MGVEIDSRSDLFAVGLILFEALTGRTPYSAESAIASLVMRSREQAVTASSVDKTIPQSLSNIISKGLEREPAKRYGTAREMIDDLEAWQGPRSRLVGARPGRVPRLERKLVIGGVLLLALVSGGVLWQASRHEQTQKAVSAPLAPVLSVAILPFRNASGDSQINWMGSSIAEMLGTDIGQSTKVRTVSTERIHQILQDLHIGPDSALDPNTLSRIASFVNADVIVSGQYVKLGDQVRVDASFRDLKQGRTASMKTESSEKDLLSSVDKLAKSVRDNLSVTPEVAKEMAATAFKPPSKSLDALRAYDEGLDLVRQGKSAEALKKFQAATTQDGGFALAYSKMAQTYSALGYDSEAENASRRALQLEEISPSPERFRIQALHYSILHDTAKQSTHMKTCRKLRPGTPTSN